MSRWLVNVRGHQFSASSMDELRQLARKGEVGGGDIVQPPGAAEWLYAVEVPELKSALRADLSDLDVPSASTGLSPMAKGILAGVLGLVAVFGWVHAYNLSQSIPEVEDLQLIGGKGGLSYTQVLVTADAGAALRASAAESGGAGAAVPKNEKADLLAKHGKWYKVGYQGKEGYVKVDEVVPAYFFADERTKLDYDPLYNPDQYCYVTNSSWMMSTDQAKSNTSVFSFMLQNDAKFEMADVKLLATIKNDQGQVVEEREVAVEGRIPPQRSEMVGTLAPARGDSSPPRVLFSSGYEEILKVDPTAADRWTDGVEVQLKDRSGTEASITLIEVRAVPTGNEPSGK